MEFNSLLDFRLFIKTKVDKIVDEDFKASLLACRDRYIPDDMYFKLNDSFNNYLNQLRFYNKNKTFFKELLKYDYLDYSNLPALNSYNTHLFICLNERFKVRNDVDLTDFKYLKGIVDGMINKIIDKGEVKNEIKKYYI